MAANPWATVAHFRSLATRDLLVGGGSIFLGVVVTGISFMIAAPGESFLVTTGFLAVGLVELVRGLSFSLKAQKYTRLAENIKLRRRAEKKRED